MTGARPDYGDLGGDQLPVPVVQPAPVKSGPRTSEFWLTVAADVAASVLLVTHRMTSTEWTALTGGTASLYGLWRTMVKR